jgi:hypothetical protein
VTEKKLPRWTEYMPLEKILRAPRNPKNHNVQVIRGSMNRFGLVEQPALDERTGRLVAGHGRLEEWYRAKAAGESAPEGVVEGADGSWSVPVSRGWSSKDDAEAEAYLITSNNSVIMGGWDETGLNEMLADLARNDFALAQVTGVSAAELDVILDAQESALADAVRSGNSAVTEVPIGQTPYGNPLDAAPWMAQTAPRYDEPIEHDQVPATGARFAESAEDEATRAARIASYQPRQGHSTGLVEMILVYPIDDRNEAARLVAAARDVLGADLKASEIILRALRVLSAVLDARETDRAVRMDAIARQAGWVREQA